ncbi:MAG: uridine kinase [Anaerolineae bacterium]|nr:uridine kinase [Anaerolineae bacterium]
MAIKRPHPIRVAIDGVDAAGKTNLADELVQPVQDQGRPVIRASIDGFHNPQAIRHQRGSISPEGYYFDSFDYQAVKSLLLEPLGPQGNRQYQTAMFSFRADAPILSQIRTAHPESILLFDGVFLLRPELSNCWDYKIFVDITFENSVARASRRDQMLFGTAEAVIARYQQRYVPGQHLYLQSCRPKERADVVVDNNNFLNPTLIFLTGNS